jgi:hypothetical protein
LKGVAEVGEQPTSNKCIIVNSTRSEEITIFGNMTFQPKIFRLKIENISFKSADGQNPRRIIIPPFFGHFLDNQKCPFCPLRAANFKTQNAKPQKTGL